MITCFVKWTRIELTAAIPEPNASVPSPFSSAVIRSSNTRTVGFPSLE